MPELNLNLHVLQLLGHRNLHPRLLQIVGDDNLDPQLHVHKLVLQKGHKKELLQNDTVMAPAVPAIYLCSVGQSYLRACAEVINSTLYEIYR